VKKHSKFEAKYCGVRILWSRYRNVSHELDVETGDICNVTQRS